jgi:hypothetical protein
METGSFIRETIEFNTAPWFRVPGYFYVPKNVQLPAPGLVVLHEWGGFALVLGVNAAIAFVMFVATTTLTMLVTSIERFPK